MPSGHRRDGYVRLCCTPDTEISEGIPSILADTGIFEAQDTYLGI